MKNKTLIILGVIILVVIAVAVLPNKNTKISIGAVIPETGFGAYWGGPVRKGIELAEKDLKKEFGENNVKVVIEDSKSDPAFGVTSAKKLLTVDMVDALYSEFSGVSSALSPIARDSGKVLVYSTFNQKIVEDNPTSIKTFISFEVACEKFARYLNDPSKKVLIISAIGDAAPYCVQGLKSGIPESNIKVVEGFTSKDFRTLLLQNKEFAPDYIIPIMYEDGSYALLKQKHEIGFGGKLFCYKQDCVTEKLINELPKEATEGTIYFEVPIDNGFITRIREAHPGISNGDIQGAANAYQSIIALGEGLASCKDKNADCVANAIANKQDFIGVGYKNLSFKDRVLVSDLSIGVIKGKQSQLVN